MPIRNYPFSIIRPGDSARPYLPVTVVNPAVNKEVRVYALIDTGADECAFPASFASLLGHNLQKGQLKRLALEMGSRLPIAIPPESSWRVFQLKMF